MNKRKRNSPEPLDMTSGNQPQNPISELELRVAQLEKDVALLKQLTDWRWFIEDAPIHKKVKPGVKERIEDAVLFNYRDGLIRWLEAYWPWMEGRLRGAKDADEVGAILEAVSEEPYLRRDWQKRLLPNPAELFDFVSSERFRKTELPLATLRDALDLTLDDDDNERCKRAANQLPTRQIANAMAGVPDVSWRRSLDRCSANPSSALLALNMDLYYREVYGLPIPADRDLTGVSSPVPKPLQPVLARSDSESKDRSQTEAK